MMPKSPHEYDPVAKSENQQSRSIATLRILSSSHEACDGIPKETPQTKATESARKSTTGWQTTALLFGFYLVALVIAILHFIMMRYLDGKPTDDSRYLAQQYVTSTSLLLVAAFKASLRSALATAFTQHMWKILRQEALRVSSIESLHGVRYNPFLLAKWRVFCAAPLLYLIAMVMWLLAIAILFPPSALTIVQQRFEEQNSTLVPTYDAGSGQDIALTTIGSGHSLSLGTSSLSTWTEVSTNVNSESVTYMSYLFPSTKLAHLSHVVLISGAVPVSQSPCGANCTYDVKFEGPTFQCTSTAHNTTSPRNSTTRNRYPYYSSSWNTYNKPYSVYGSFDMKLTQGVGYYPGFFLLDEFRMQCQPARGKYDVVLRYENGLRTFSHQVTEVETLLDTFVGGVAPDQGEAPDYKPNTSIPWTQEMIGNLRNINHYAVLDTIVSTLAGSYDQAISNKPGPAFSYKLPNGTTVEFKPVGPSFTVDDTDGARIEGISMEIQPNKTWIRDTQFNLNRENGTSTGPELVISADILKDIVANVTIAAMLSYHPLSYWNATVDATVATNRNVYSFSRPLNLILPYAFSLLASLPFLVIGYLSLQHNGVAALSDSFLQLLVTMTRSEQLDHVAQPCSLGGDEQATEDLKLTRIMFGELAGGGQVVRRIGFGLEDEIVPLRRGTSTCNI